MTKRITSQEITRTVKRVAAQGPEAENRLIDLLVAAMDPRLTQTNPPANKTTLS